MATSTTSTKRSKPAAETAKPKPILEIETLAPVRPFLTVDSERHDFRLRQDFGALEDAQFNRASREYDALYRSDDPLDEADEKRMLSLLDWLVDAVLLDSARLRGQAGDALTGAMKREIVISFTNAPLLMAAMAQTEAETEAGTVSSTTAS